MIYIQNFSFVMHNLQNLTSEPENSDNLDLLKFAMQSAYTIRLQEILSFDSIKFRYEVHDYVPRHVATLFGVVVLQIGRLQDRQTYQIHRVLPDYLFPHSHNTTWKFMIDCYEVLEKEPFTLSAQSNEALYQYFRRCKNFSYCNYSSSLSDNDFYTCSTVIDLKKNGYINLNFIVLDNPPDSVIE